MTYTNFKYQNFVNCEKLHVHIRSLGAHCCCANNTIFSRLIGILFLSLPPYCLVWIQISAQNSIARSNQSSSGRIANDRLARKQRAKLYRLISFYFAPSSMVFRSRCECLVQMSFRAQQSICPKANCDAWNYMRILKTLDALPIGVSFFSCRLMNWLRVSIIREIEFRLGRFYFHETHEPFQTPKVWT